MLRRNHQGKFENDVMLLGGFVITVFCGEGVKKTKSRDVICVRSLNSGASAAQLSHIQRIAKPESI